MSRTEGAYGVVRNGQSPQEEHRGRQAGRGVDTPLVACPLRLMDTPCRAGVLQLL